ncbi:MAG: RagB/SusD family nutrient uptake outer membrane protein [Flectobacillus sp.]|uniref:RagB/SusD family nutrient uptake outer membrane protein n=1 Tax=Flectobacillus sp. TaxID=50419 RepID=UPI003B9C6574
MLKKIYLQTIALSALLLTTACDSWLELRPQDGIVQDRFWNNKEQVASAVGGIYASIIDVIPEKVFVMGEIRADMVSSSFRITNNELEILNSNILPTNPLTDWRDFYRIINYCNTVIAFAPSVLEKDKTYTQEALKAHVAEAKAIRAWMYFYIARLYGDAPLKLSATSSDDEIVPIAKSPQKDILAQIEKDLLEAETDAPSTYGTREKDHGRVTKYMINTLQADVYLWMEKPNEALAATNKVINSSKFGLVSNPGARGNSWFSVVRAGNSNEGIFELAFGSDYTLRFGITNYPMYAIFGLGSSSTYRRYQASAYVNEEVFTEDLIDPTNYDTRADESSLTMTTGVIRKYDRTSGDSPFNVIMYRYADVLLFKAEALAMLNRGAEALAIIQQIRTRAWAIPQTEKSPDPANIDGSGGVLDYILEERAREFAFEGKRWFDVLRHAKRANYKRIDLLLDLTARSVPVERQQSAIAKIKDPNSHYLPIYQYEIQTNKLLVQNPFYK